MSNLNRSNLGFLLAKASQRWNGLLHAGFVKAGFPEVKPSYGAILVPLFEEDGLRLGELAERARLSKQTMTTMVRLIERDGLVVRKSDPADARAGRVFLTAKARRFQAVAEKTLGEIERRAGAIAGPIAREATRKWLKEFAES
ncbi:MAG: MarR family winged helix-turn-helix transcriptional regulator [Pseudomonadota bacterium]